MNELPVLDFVFNIVVGIVKIFIKSWNQLLYPRVIEVCRLPFETRHDFFLHLIIVVELFPARCFYKIADTDACMTHYTTTVYTAIFLKMNPRVRNM